MEIEKDVFDYLIRLEEKANKSQAELLSINTSLNNLKEKIDEYQLNFKEKLNKTQTDFKFHFGLLWSAIGIIVTSLVTLAVAKLV